MYRYLDFLSLFNLRMRHSNDNFWVRQKGFLGAKKQPGKTELPNPMWSSADKWLLIHVLFGQSSLTSRTVSKHCTIVSSYYLVYEEPSGDLIHFFL